MTVPSRGGTPVGPFPGPCPLPHSASFSLRLSHRSSPGVTPSAWLVGSTMSSEGDSEPPPPQAECRRLPGTQRRADSRERTNPPLSTSASPSQPCACVISPITSSCFRSCCRSLGTKLAPAFLMRLPLCYDLSQHNVPVLLYLRCCSARLVVCPPSSFSPRHHLAAQGWDLGILSNGQPCPVARTQRKRRWAWSTLTWKEKAGEHWEGDKVVRRQEMSCRAAAN
ncbi:PREDICTED: uncharacterized protein LOC102014523 [Chinchilla lanigera]|uniref:uncharacterized protein LOC102014523 n=1 Tax=Chinchilla lanigera TaxID=34839 RepID=UPI00038EE869|nr:PREDICTED: uncharacterized protein LOC102014523 [Chinchilla lanigera]